MTLKWFADTSCPDWLLSRWLGRFVPFRSEMQLVITIYACQTCFHKQCFITFCRCFLFCFSLQLLFSAAAGSRLGRYKTRWSSACLSGDGLYRVERARPTHTILDYSALHHQQKLCAQQADRSNVKGVSRIPPPGPVSADLEVWFDLALQKACVGCEQFLSFFFY